MSILIKGHTSCYTTVSNDSILNMYIDSSPYVVCKCKLWTFISFLEFLLSLAIMVTVTAWFYLFMFKNFSYVLLHLHLRKYWFLSKLKWALSWIYISSLHFYSSQYFQKTKNFIHLLNGFVTSKNICKMTHNVSVWYPIFVSFIKIYRYGKWTKRGLLLIHFLVSD